jgi:hypothetical protein
MDVKAAAPPGELDRRVVAMAATQHGIVTLRQLERCGLGRGAIEMRLRADRLQRLYRGVYAFGQSELRYEAVCSPPSLRAGRERP